MSALDQLRQVINTSRDLFKEYDSDAVSLTSTVVEEEGDYDSNGIIAEDAGKERPYLMSWENYALDQCTWEPKHNIDAGDILLRWKQLKEELGTVAFQRENEANKQAYAEAQAKAQAARDRRHAKREQKRQRLRRRHRTILSDDDSSDDESFSKARTRQGLFVQDEEPPNPASPVLDPPPKVPPSVTRQLPLQQSSSEEESLSEGEISDHPLISEPRKSNITHRDRNNTAKEPIHRSIPSQGGSGSSVPNKTTTAPVSHKTKDGESRASTKPVARNAVKSNTMRAIKTAQPKQASRAINFIDEPMEKQKRLWSTDQQYSKAAMRWRAEKRSRTEAAPDFSALSFVNGPPPTLPKATSSRPNDNPYGRRETANHRHDEETEDDGPRREVMNTTAPHAAWEADKVPQVCFHWKSSTCPHNPEECRFMHKDTDPEGKPYPVGDFDGRLPHKYRNPPITCPFWYKGRKCTKTDEECLYAHRNTGWAELNGVPTKIDDLPPQYLAPVGPSKLTPITCSFWLYNPQSCSKSAEDCKYAHHNTGWARPESDPQGEPVRINPELKPRGVIPKYATPPVTCLFWLRAEKSCSRTDSECRYAHWNTGWAPPIENNDRPLPTRFRVLPGNRAAVPIDRAETPYYDGSARELAIDYAIPKNGNPPVMCYFWLEGSNSCAKLAKNCRFAHRNTGWVFHNGESKQIDPTMLPRSRKLDPTEATQVPYNHTKPTVQPLSRALDEDSMDMVIHMPTDTANAAVQDLHHQHVQSPLETQVSAHREPVAVPSLSQVRSKIEDVLNLDIVEMFFPLALGDNEPLERQAMLLYDPKEHPEELELITRWLLLHNVRVTNLWYGGAWSQFRHDVEKHKSGVIIAHPDFEQYTELPGFGDVLKQRVRVWSVGPQPPPEFVFGVQQFPERLRYERVGLFPHGGLIYITDDVFEQKPQLALSIVKLFAAKIEQLRQLEGPDSWWLRVDDAYLLWRLCVRPELMEYLYFKCRDNSEELEAGSPGFMSYYELYVLLTATHYIEQDNPIAPLSTVHDKYPILSHRRQLAEHPSINYFNLLESSQEEANTQMITHYAEVHSAFLRRDYRHFYVVRTEPTATCAQQWEADIHTVTEIVTPERCIEELSKSSKESLFDFMEWALEPKVQKPDAAPAEAEFRHISICTIPLRHAAAMQTFWQGSCAKEIQARIPTSEEVGTVGT